MMTDEMMLMYIMVYISLRFCILYDTLLLSKECGYKEDVEPGMSSVCCVLLYLNSRILKMR